MNYPQHLYYTGSHQWLCFEEPYVFMGITDFMQKELGQVLTVTIPYLNKTVESGKFLGSIEATRTALDLLCR